MYKYTFWAANRANALRSKLVPSFVRAAVHSWAAALGLACALWMASTALVTFGQRLTARLLLTVFACLWIDFAGSSFLPWQTACALATPDLLAGPTISELFF